MDPEWKDMDPGCYKFNVRLCLEKVSAFEVSGLGTAVLGLSGITEKHLIFTKIEISPPWGLPDWPFFVWTVPWTRATWSQKIRGLAAGRKT